MGRPPIGERAMTAAEKMRRYRARKFGNKPPVTKSTATQIDPAATRQRIDSAIAPLEARVRELEAELARERGRAKMLEEGLKLAQRQARAASPPKAAKPPLPPDEARDRRIKALTTENQNLKAKLRYMADRYNDGLATAGGMSFKTQSAIAKVLHPDTRNNATGADKDEAFKRFTAWKADKDKAGRQAR
jgi:hypothetical protein